LIESGGLSAGFLPSPFGGIAPLEVCFTDTSISGSPIIRWDWDFGDGNTALNAGPNICHTYADPGQAYNVSLTVENSSFVDNATNIVRTYNLLEISANFGIQPQGGRTFCFVEQNPADVSVTGWAFGDGNGDGAVDQTCHTYGADGTYAVEMYVTNGTLTGTVVRPVVALLTSDPPPVIDVGATCAPDTTATFTVTNTGGNMTTPDQVTIRDNAGNVILIAPLQLAANETTTYSVTGYIGTITLETSDTLVSTNTDCVEPPILSASGTCEIDGTATFTVTNTSTVTAASQTYTIVDAANNVVDTGTIDVPVNGTAAVSVSGVWGPLTFSSDDATYGPTASVTANSDCDTPPLLTATNLCETDGITVFTVTNASPDTPANQDYEVRNSNGQIVNTGVLNIPVNDSQEIRVTGNFGPMTLTSTGPQGTTTTINDTSSCVAPPLLTASGTCQIDGTAAFTVTNGSPITAASQTYTIVDAANNVVDTGTIDVPALGTATVLVSGVWEPLTFSSDDPTYGPPASVTTNTNCGTPPILTSTNLCETDGTTVFTVTNSSPNTPASQNYEVRDANGQLVDNGVLNIAVNSSQEIRITNSYGPLTLTSDGPQGATTSINDTSSCLEPPILRVEPTCDGNNAATFTIFNDSNDSAASQTYEVYDGSNVLITSGTINVPAGGQDSVVVPNATGIVTLISSGPEGTTTEINISTSCNEAPVLTGTATCTVDGAVFTVENISPMNPASQTYEVVDASGTVIDSGTLTVPPSSSTDITVTGDFGPLTFTSSSPAGPTTDITIESSCGGTPVLVATSICEGNNTTVFVVTNQSSTPTSQTYEITSADTGIITTGTVDVPANGSQEIRITGDFGPLTLTGTGISSYSTTSTCQNTATATDAPLSGSVACSGDDMVTFIITNNGTNPVSQIYTITTPGGEQAGGGLLEIAAGGTVSISAQTSGTALTFVTGGDAGALTLTVDGNCAITTYFTGEPGTPPMTSTGTVPRLVTTPPFPSFLPQLDLIPRLDTSIVERPAWEGITVGGAVCVDWLIYHTNMTGDWEIFRLGDDNGRLAEFDPNLSQGRGVDVVDMAPTRSPDSEWVAFTSNRDSTPEEENWELYIAKVDNSEIRRVTYNTFAKDIDPAWSPDGRYIVFETDRDGNWELYLLDLATGAETRLTDSPFSDVNAFWSPDSKSLAFQSDRDGLWQIYTIDIVTGEETLMSDGIGEDHDPSYSFEGDRILFRSYRDGANSTIYVMDDNGENLTRISDPRGSATNHTWSPDDSVIAYQSDLDGDLDIYAYEVEDKETRLVTDNNIHDYAPTWFCDAPLIVFTSDVVGDPNIFNTPALPIEAPAILVDREASQMTFDPADDVYPENNPAEENASREGSVPPRIDLE